MLRECASYFEQGLVKLIPTFMTVPAENVVDAFRHMQKGTHIGKFAVTVPTDLSHLPVSAGDPSLEL
ncbi:hypothetical protein J3459_013068 [Metarhizium acridum]|nr:hypothetical protein J3459_013068 [Metarhizium acridum]